MSEEDNYYTDKTEDPQFIDSVLQEEEVNPKGILSVLGAGWPIEFQRMYPYSKVYSFDANSSQIAEFGADVFEVTKNRPILASAPSNKLFSLINRGGVDFLFLSNIPDYLKADEAYELGENISETGVKTVLFSTLGEKMPSSQTRQSSHSLQDSLKESGFRIRRFVDSSHAYEINEYFVARKS